MNTLNQTVLDLIKEYPTDGTHQYFWENGFDGVTRHLTYNKAVIARSEAQKRTYCCGLSFEIWFRAAMAHKMNLGLAADVRKIKAEWFITKNKYPEEIWRHAGPLDALIPLGLGLEATLEQAEPGDFLQLWRQNGSGHSVIFMERAENGFRYWSTQPSTKGIGLRTEYFTGKNPVTHVHIVRATIK